MCKTSEHYEPFKDQDMPSCFGVDMLAECFVKQMDEISKTANENICMLGIFGSWGRGKSYFFKKVKDYIQERSSSPIKYKIVEFNAWKYQETPALWAYLYETIYAEGSSLWQKLKLFWKKIEWRNMGWYIFMLLLLYVIYQILNWFQDDAIKNYVKVFMQKWRIPMIWGSLAFAVLYEFINNPAGAFSYMKRYTRRVSYKNLMGIQNEIESMLESLLCVIVDNPRTEKLLLYIDDIDRCPTDKMLSIMDSFRTVLENPKIRERLVIVCSVDAEKLKRGYESQYKNVYTNETLCAQYAREQLDKLFISGLGLARLDIGQKRLFIRRLAGVSQNNAPSNSNIRTTNNDAPYSIYRENESFIATRQTEELDIISNETLVSWMEEFLSNMDNTKDEITPRKLRIMYYQLWFANNIIATQPDTLFTAGLAFDLLNMSFHHNKDNIRLNRAFEDIIEMTVPY